MKPDVLTPRERRIAKAIARYHTEHRTWPTTRELFDAMRSRGEIGEMGELRPRLRYLQKQGVLKLIGGEGAKRWQA